MEATVTERGEWKMGNGEWGMGNGEWGKGKGEELLPITNYQLPITNYQLPITNYQLPITNYQLPITNDYQMKLPRTTLILILLALGGGTFVYFYEIKGASVREEVKEKKQQIFLFAADDVQSLTVKTENVTLNLERNNNGGDTKWLIKSPRVSPANDPIVSYLMDLLVKGKSDRILSIPANQLADFGLNPPQATININLKNQKTHQLTLGKPDFNRRFLYAQVDPTPKADGNINVLLVSTDFENAVKRELSEWQQPGDNNIKNLPSPIQPNPAKTK